MKPSTPTTPPSTATSEPASGVEIGPRHYAPHLYDPDPPEEPMTPQQSKEFARKAGELMRKKGYIK